MKNIKLKKFFDTLLSVLQTIIYSALVASSTFALGNMQLEKLPAIGGAVLAIFLAFTALLYNRARAYGPSPIQRRTLLAAEISLRATMLYIFGILVTAVIFIGLASDPRFHAGVWYKWPTQLGPVIGSVIPTALFGFAFMELYSSVQLILKPMSFFTSVKKHMRMKGILRR